MRKLLALMITTGFILISSIVVASETGGLPELQTQIDSLRADTDDLNTQLANMPKIYTGGILATSQFTECVNELCVPKTAVLVVVPEKQAITLEAIGGGVSSGKFFLTRYDPSVLPITEGEIEVMYNGTASTLSRQFPMASSVQWGEEPVTFPFKCYLVSDSLIRLVFDGADTVKQISSVSAARYTDISFDPWKSGDLNLVVHVTIQNIGLVSDQYMVSMSSPGAEKKFLQAQTSERLYPSGSFSFTFTLHFTEGIQVDPVPRLYIMLQSLSGDYWDGDDGGYYHAVTAPTPNQ